MSAASWRSRKDNTERPVGFEIGIVRVCLVALTTFWGTPGRAAPPVPRGQDKPPGPALSPAEAIEKMTVPEGFKVEVVAAEPDLVNPVAMTFDERGRIWVTESFEYPRREAGPGRDRIKILEDTDQDGRVDKVTIFAEGLNIPSGIAVGHGGVWVVNSPDLLFLQDTDNDGKADKQEVVVTGFGRDDTHELPNSLTWGPDGWLYGLNGVFNPSHVNYRGKSYDFTCALFRIHPRTRDFHVFCEGTSNPWGVAWDSEGSAFVSACVIDHLWHLVETGYYHRQGGPYPPFTWKIESIVKHHHQKAAYCGIHYFDSDAYPEPYRDKLYMGNIHGNCINVDQLQRNGSTYLSQGLPDFLSGNDAWFMPVAQKTGPDGCLYVLDWYDQYHCYQDALRDPEGIERAKGRLYRVRYQNTPRAPAFDLAKETDDQLIERLASPNVFYRDLAQRVLCERSDPATRKKLQILALDTAAPRKARLHALWTVIGADPNLDEQFLTRVLAETDPTFRAWGVRALGNAGRADEGALRHLESLARDPSADVRLQVAITAAKTLPDPLPLLLNVQQSSWEDALIPHVVWQNLHPRLETRGNDFLKLTEDQRLVTSPALAAIWPRAVERILGVKQVSPATVVQLLQMLTGGEQVQPAAAQQCLALLATRVQTGEISGETSAALKSRLQPVLAPLLKPDGTSPLFFDAAILSASWKEPAGLKAVRESLAAGRLPAPQRLQAVQAMTAAGDPELLSAVRTLLLNREANSLELRGQVLDTLGRSDDAGVAELLLQIYSVSDAALQPKVIEVLTQRPEWARRLLQAIGQKQVLASALNLNQVRKLQASKDQDLIKLVQSQWGTVREQRNPQREGVINELRSYLRANPGDSVRGNEVFKKLCGQCHKMHGEGYEVGPDITVNGRASFEQLLSNVFDPSLVIGAAYQARTIATQQGRVLTGLVVEEGDERVVLKLQGGKLEVIPRTDIDEMKVSQLSLMPEELEKQVKPEELSDLFAFITLDKPPTDPTARLIPGTRDATPRATSDPSKFDELLREVAPGFHIAEVGEGGVAVVREHLGRGPVVRTHPIKEGVPCVLSRELAIPAGKQTRLIVSAGHDERGDWQLIIKANGEKLLDQVIGPASAKNGWVDLEIELSQFAGKTIQLELQNFPNNWAWEFGYWAHVAVISR